MRKKSVTTIILILVVIAIAVWTINRPLPETDEEIAECIGQNSVLYTQLGCHACEIQESYFGDYSDKLNIVDCLFDQQACIENNIKATPTWIINGEAIIGARSVEKLRELTGC